MSLPAAPPARSEATLPVRNGSSGWPVYALQCALVDAYNQALQRDGAFGPATDLALRKIQRDHGLAADGVAGPKTWLVISDGVCRRVGRMVTQVPVVIIKGFARGEGGNHGAAVNDTIKGGVDCGLFQRRVVGPPYNPEALRIAFSPVSAGAASMRLLADRAAGYRTIHPRCPYDRLQLAVGAHNWPWAADQYFRYGKLPNPGAKATWVPASLPASAKTYAGWFAFYIHSITGRG